MTDTTTMTRPQHRDPVLRAKEDRIRRLANEKGYKIHKPRGHYLEGTWALLYTAPDYTIGTHRFIRAWGLALDDVERWITTLTVDEGYDLSDAWHKWSWDNEKNHVKQWLGFDFAAAMDDIEAGR